MIMFFELREYRTLPGQRENWVRFMEEEIIPFQVSKGMVILGSFVGEEEADLYVWIRRFESEEEREKLYAAVYESDNWINEIGPKIPEMMDRSKIVVRRLEASSRSVIQ
ncbi:MAG TPA: NIPSNAP family containing protein [Dehalococcoidia bacterium]|nr:NIPSNAP family containing protein [Dehalococcoidia bacterium]